MNRYKCPVFHMHLGECVYCEEYRCEDIEIGPTNGDAWCHPESVVERRDEADTEVRRLRSALEPTLRCVQRYTNGEDVDMSVVEEMLSEALDFADAPKSTHIAEPVDNQGQGDVCDKADYTVDGRVYCGRCGTCIDFQPIHLSTEDKS